MLDLIGEGEKASPGLALVLLGRATPHFDSLVPTVISYDGRYSLPWSLAQASGKLRRVLQDSGVRVIHTHGWDADIIGWLARIGLRKEQVIHIHVTPDWLESRASRHKIRRWITRLALSWPGVRIVAVSDAVRHHWASDDREILEERRA